MSKVIFFKQIAGELDHTDTDDPTIAAIGNPIIAKWEAAVLRVAAAEAQPALYVLPKGAHDSPEEILASRFRTLPKTVKDRSGDRAVQLLAVPKRSAHLASFLNLDLASAKSVDQLLKVEAANTKITKETLLNGLDRRRANLGLPDTAGSSSVGARRRLRLDLIRMACIDETGGFWAERLGDDEISLSGVAIDEGAELGKLAPFKVGDFNDHTVKSFQPQRRLYTFDTGEGATYPKYYFMSFILAEVDQGNLSETMDRIIAKLKAAAQKKISDLLGDVATARYGPAVGELVRVIVDYAVGKIVDFLVRVWEDDLFKPVTVGVGIPDAHATLNHPSEVIQFTGPGHYAMRYQWREG